MLADGFICHPLAVIMHKYNCLKSNKILKQLYAVSVALLL